MDGSNKSEVVRLLHQIELEYQAATLGLTGVAAVARHKVITTRMENMQRCHAQLQEVVGEYEAARLVAKTLENA